MRVSRRQIGLLGLGALLLAVLVGWSGVISVAASSGHWRLTEWTLHWIMRNSVQTYAHFDPPPPHDLDDEYNVRQAAGHFETGCAGCHGSPLRGPPRVGQHMTPPPPPLGDVARQWDARLLFHIVKHGIKYTAMPAWPAFGRDDEVWAMVGFLRALPRLDVATYGTLALGAADGAKSDERWLADCARCHGRDGSGRDAAAPVIAGQSETYLVESLRAFAKGARRSGIMETAVDAVPDADLIALAKHYAHQGGLAEAPPSSGGAGESIANRGLPEAGVPACQSCHGPATARNAAYPRLAGQQAAYLAAQLRLMRAGERGGTAYAPIMQHIARRLPDQAIDAVADYYAANPESPKR